MKAAILLSRGEHGGAPHGQLSRWVELVSSRLGEEEPWIVMGAFIDKGAPSLPDALQTCAENGANSIAVLPVFLPGDENLQKWLAKVMMRWSAQWSGEKLVMQLLPSPAQGTGWSDAIVAALHEYLTKAPDLCENPPAEWEHDPEGWSHIPPHRYHLLICQGPRCTARGASQIWEHLMDRLHQENLAEQPNGTLTVSTGCLYPCNHGPVLVVHPDNVWYNVPSNDAVDEIVAQHLINGHPVEKYRISL